MNDRLAAMQRAMIGLPVRSFGQVAAPVRGYGSAQPTEVEALRRALAVERAARISAEQRLDALVREIARMRAASLGAARMTQPALPAASPTVLEPDEVIMPDEMPLGERMRLALIDGDEEEENDDG